MNTLQRFLVFALSAFVLSSSQDAAAYDNGCGNDGQDGCECDCVGANPINPQRGSVLREVDDIATFGQAPVTFKRYYVSRPRDYTQNKWELGAPHVWQHNWNYEIRNSATTSFGFPNIIVRYPEGFEYRYHAVDASGSVRVADASFGDRLYPWSGNTGFTLVRPDGQELDFAKIGSNNYRFEQLRATPGVVYTLTYDASARLIRVANGYGRYIDISRVTVNGVYAIHAVTTNDGRIATFAYGTWAPTGHSVLESVMYPDGAQAAYSYVGRYGTNSGLPLLATAIDPGFHGPGSQVRYVYNYNALSAPPYGLTVGVVLEERNLVTDEVVASLPLGGGEYPQVFDGSIEVTRKYANGLLAEMADGEGRRVQIGRSAGGYGYIQALTYDNGAVASFTKDYAGRTLTETNPLGSTKTRGYDATGYLTSSANELSETTTITRDAAHRPISRSYPDGSSESWTYDVWGLPATHTLRSGGIETFVRYGQGVADGKPGDLWKHTDPLGNTTTYTHDAAGNVASITDARGNTTTYTYDAMGRRVEEVHPDTSGIGYQYDAFGHLVSTTNELGQTNSIMRDSFGRVVAETDPLGGKTWYEYNASQGCASCGYRENPTRIESPDGQVETREYDRSGLLIEETSAEGTSLAATTAYGYDVVGQLLHTENPANGVTSLVHDLAGRVIAVMDPLGRTSTHAYDAVGRLVATTTPDGSTTQFVLDAMGQVETEIDPLNQTTSRSYNVAGELVALQDAKGNIHEFVRDALGRVTILRYPDGSEEHFSFDSVGNRSSYTTRTGDVMTCSFDVRNRGISCKYASESTGVTHTYDLASQIVGVTNENASTSYAHDASGRTTSATYLVNGAPARTIAYTYDADGHRMSATYPSGKNVAYSRDNRGRVAAISMDGVPVVAYGYDSMNRRVNEAFGNGWTTVRSYDDAGQATAIVASFGAKNSVSAAYGYDNAGRRTSALRADGKQDTYAYDATGQIVTVDYGLTSNGTIDLHADYTFDAVGNRLALSSGVNKTFYTTNNLNQMTMVNSSSVHYDGRGNLTSWPGLTLDYDVRDRLTSANVGPLKKPVVTAYDGEDHAVIRTYAGQTMYRIFDDEWNLVEEWNAQGGLVATYVYAPGMDSIVARISKQGTLYYHRDALGSVTHLSDASGAVAERYTYDVFGAATVTTPSGLTQSKSAVGNPFMFTGRELLPVGQVYDYRHRAYLPPFGRFAQVDPIRFVAGDVNMYRYVGNGPVDRVDPTGMCETETTSEWVLCYVSFGPFKLPAFRYKTTTKKKKCHKNHDEPKPPEPKDPGPPPEPKDPGPPPEPKDPGPPPEPKD